MSIPLAVTFDLWQTLIIDQPGWGEIRKNQRLQGALDAFSQVGMSFSWEQMEDAYRRCFEACQVIRGRGLDISFDEQVHIFVNEIRQGIAETLDAETFAKVANTYREAYFSQPLPVAPGTHEILGRLQRRGLRLGLISNTGMTPGVTFRRVLDDLGLLEYFDVLTFSDEVALAKPFPGIFLLTLEKLGVDPECAVHVGDTPEHDVLGAKGVGMNSVWISHGRRQEMDPRPDAVVDNLKQISPVLDLLLERLAKKAI